MEFNQIDRLLFAQVVKHMRAGKRKGRTTAHVKQAELLWVGQHYLIIREGPEAGQRDTQLYSREWLLLDRGNPEGNAMVELALAAVDPVHHVLPSNRRLLLHSTAELNGHEKFRGRRWCKSLLADLIEFGREKDRLLPDLERAESFKFVNNNAFSQRMVGLVKEAGFEVSGTLEEHGIEFPVGRTYSSAIGGHMGSAFQNRFEFTPGADLRIGVRLRDTSVSSEEFEILVEAMSRIDKLKKNRTPLYAAPQEEDM